MIWAQLMPMSTAKSDSTENLANTVVTKVEEVQVKLENTVLYSEK